MHFIAPVNVTAEIVHFSDIGFTSREWPIAIMAGPPTPEVSQTREGLKTFMAAHRLKASRWADDAGVARNTLLNFLKGQRDNISVKILEKLAAAKGTTVAEITGITPGQRASRGAALIKRLEVKAAAGGGFSVVPDPISPPVILPKDFVHRTFGTDIENLRFVEFAGDSMFPTIRDGDLGIVHRIHNMSEFRSGELYVLWDGIGVVVKRVEAVVGKQPKLRIVSDNSSTYQPYEVDAADVRFIGKVLWRAGKI